MGSAFFPVEIDAAAVALGQIMDSECLSAIVEASEGVPHKIRLANWPTDSHEQIWGMKLGLRWPMTMAHSGWLFRHASQAPAGEDATRVGCLVEGVFKELEQFSLINATREVYLVAVGARGREVLQAVAEAETLYVPGSFDEDGYFRPMPTQRATDVSDKELEMVNNRDVSGSHEPSHR